MRRPKIKQERTEQEWSKQECLAMLRASLGRLDGRSPWMAAPTGIAAIDAVLPLGGLRRGALHEIMAGRTGSGRLDGAAAEGFAATLLAGLAQHGPVLWCSSEAGLYGPRLYGPGLAGFGLAPDRLILVRARRPIDLLWAMEEGLRSPGLGAVLGQVETLDLTESRRLLLAAEASGVTALVLHPDGDKGRDGRKAGSTAAATRWRVIPEPSESPSDSSSGLGSTATERDFGPDFGLRRARWRVELLRCRGAAWAAGEGLYGAWLMEAGNASSAVAVSVPMDDRSAAAAASEWATGERHRAS
jgi:protein ImuA